MALKILPRPNGRMVKMGRKRPATPFTGKHLKDYLRYEKPPAPPVPFSYAKKAQGALRHIYGNDVYGDCVIAARMHVEGVVTGNAGDLVTFTHTDVVREYGVCGYVPGDPSTDQGCDVRTVLDYWVNPGWAHGGSTAAGYLAVDPAHVGTIQTACWLFENLVFGVELPDAWVNPMPSSDGFVWDVAGEPDPENGHCFCGFGASHTGILIDTWALELEITYAAIARYAAAEHNGELFVVITQDVINRASKRAPDGLDWAQLVTDFNAMGGNLTMPAT